MRQKIFTFLGILLSTWLSAAVPDGTVKGKVSDSKTGDPLPGVYVIYGKNLGTTTDSAGTFHFNAAAGKVLIAFHFVG